MSHRTVRLRKQLSRVLTDAEVSVSLLASAGAQQITGQHLVAMDGRVNLGTYGSVRVAGMTIEEARTEIEKKLTEKLDAPEVFVDVLAYNSKVYYIITQGAGLGDDVVRAPITGNETVLDAVGQINGLPPVASKKRIWVARPAPADAPCDQVLPVDWRAISQGGSTATNYQLFPGDRVYVKADALITLDNTLAKIISPIERLFGITLLGNATVRSFERGNGSNGGTGVGGF